MNHLSCASCVLFLMDAYMVLRVLLHRSRDVMQVTIEKGVWRKFESSVPVGGGLQLGQYILCSGSGIIHCDTIDQ